MTSTNSVTSRTTFQVWFQMFSFLIHVAKWTMRSHYVMLVFLFSLFFSGLVEYLIIRKEREMKEFGVMIIN